MNIDRNRDLQEQHVKLKSQEEKNRQLSHENEQLKKKYAELKQIRTSSGEKTTNER